MDRLWTKALVFCGLLGVAGLLFGVPESHVFLPTRLILPEAEQSVPWFILLAFPLSLALVIFSVWLAGRWATGSSRLGLRAVAAAHFPLVCGAIWIGIAFAVAIGEFAFTSGTILGILIVLMSVNTVELVRQGRLAKQRTPEQKAESKRLAWGFIKVGVPLLLVAGFAGYLVDHDAGQRSWELYGFSSMAGFSLPLAVQLHGVGLIDFARWLTYALCAGGVLGVLTGVMFTMGSEGDIRGRMLRRSAIGAVLGAVCSGVMFAAHSVLLLQSYRVAWNPHDILVSSLWIWCITGLLGGLMLTGAVHVMSAVPAERPSRLRTVASLLALPLLYLSLWSNGFVRHYDAGRHLLAEADKLEGQCFWIGIDMDMETRKEPPGNLIMHLHADGSLTSDTEKGRYDRTVLLCDQLTREHPDSAFYSAALYMKYVAESGNWQPQEALATRRALDQRYPHQGYMFWGRGWDITDHMLAGDYEEVLRIYREHGSSAWHNSGIREFYAARVLGRWDDAIGICRAVTTDIQSGPGSRKALGRWKERLAHVQSMKAKGAGATLRVDVLGSVIQDGKPISGVRVCLLPVDAGRDPKPITTPSGAAAIGGVLGVTDECGVYRIRGVPVGDYEVLIVASPGRLSAGTKAGGPDLPIIVRSRGAELKDIKLTSPPQ